MRILLLTLLGLMAAVLLKAQSIASLNQNYLYDPNEEVQALLHAQHEEGKMRVDYRLSFKPIDNLQQVYVVLWETRESYTQRVGTEFKRDSVVIGAQSKPVTGFVSVDLREKPYLLVLIIRNQKTGRQWNFHHLIEVIFPVRGRLENENGVWMSSYVSVGESYKVVGSGPNTPMFVSFYRNQKFPPALPPFAEKLATVERFLFHDSLFQVRSGETIRFKSPGLYLFQEDTAAAEGFTMMAVPPPFPKFNRVEQIRDPLMYVCTPDEYKSLEAAGSDKALFDKVILEITRDKDRARNFMRSYFRRVELANTYFTSYKEGWRSDRGMIYLVFGPPDELLFNSGNQVWRYRALDVSFTFVKSGSVYDPDHFILLRDKRFAEAWYSTIDLWRKARF